jgi:hypothetical protein
MFAQNNKGPRAQLTEGRDGIPGLRDQPIEAQAGGRKIFAWMKTV